MKQAIYAIAKVYFRRQVQIASDVGSKLQLNTLRKSYFVSYFAHWFPQIAVPAPRSQEYLQI